MPQVCDPFLVLFLIHLDLNVPTYPLYCHLEVWDLLVVLAYGQVLKNVQHLPTPASHSMSSFLHFFPSPSFPLLDLPRLCHGTITCDRYLFDSAHCSTLLFPLVASPLGPAFQTYRSKLLPCSLPDFPLRFNF